MKRKKNIIYDYEKNGENEDAFSYFYLRRPR